MATGFFGDIKKVKYEGPNSANPLAYRFYNKDEVVAGKRLEDHLRFSIAYWHSFAWEGGDPFGGRTFDRPWYGDTIEKAKLKADVAFEMFTLLGVPYYCFHDADVRPEGKTFSESAANLDAIVDIFEKKQKQTGVKLLWGTANLFSNRRFMAGAATNPDPDVFAYAAATVKKCIDVTKRLKGENYVLWGGREGYETLLNTNMKQEIDQLGHFLSLVAEHKHKIGFKGTLLIEPKPKEPTKHQYDFDTAAVYAFLQKYDLDKEYKVNIEANHAILSGHSFQHEVAYAVNNDILGSLDMNRGDSLLGWDTDQFPNDVAEIAIVLFTLLKGGGFSTGGMNFDAKLRRPSIDAEDLFHAHIGGLDTLARGLLAAEKMITDGKLEAATRQRYAGWERELGQRILKGKATLADLSKLVLDQDLEPKPKSGRQEYLENLVNRYV